MDELPLPILLTIAQNIPDEEDWERVRDAFDWTHPIFDYHRLLHINIRRLSGHLRRHSRERREELARSHLLSLPSLPGAEDPHRSYYNDNDPRLENIHTRSADTRREFAYVYDEALVRFWRRVVDAERELRRNLLGRHLRSRPCQEELVSARILPRYASSMDREMVRRRWLYERSVSESLGSNSKDAGDNVEGRIASPRMSHDDFEFLLQQWKRQAPTHPEHPSSA